VIPADQASETQVSCAAAPPSKSSRTAEVVTPSGWLRANGCSQPGSVLTGTMALLAKRRRKVGPVPAFWALSGSLAEIPIAVFIQLKE
jgi:hypothetical protein